MPFFTITRSPGSSVAAARPISGHARSSHGTEHVCEHQAHNERAHGMLDLEILLDVAHHDGDERGQDRNQVADDRLLGRSDDEYDGQRGHQQQLTSDHRRAMRHREDDFDA